MIVIMIKSAQKFLTGFILTAVFPQGSMEQRESVYRLSGNRNMDIIPTCPLENFNILSCDVTDVQGKRLTTGNGEYLTRIEIRINTCNSSLSPVFMFSDNTIKRNDELRCPMKIPLGQLNIMFDLKTFINQSTNLTVIDTAVSSNYCYM